jgi:ribosomal protein S18 acetylase RimI-like enzyme
VSLDIRHAAVADAAVLAEMVDAFNVEYGMPAGMHTPQSIRREVFGPDPAFAGLIAWDGATAAGYTLYYPTYDTIHAGRGFYMQDLWVRPAYRGRATGRQLLAALARLAVKQGRIHVWWGVDRRNLRGRAFYERAGSQVIDTCFMALEGEALRALAAEGG